MSSMTTSGGAPAPGPTPGPVPPPPGPAPVTAPAPATVPAVPAAPRAGASDVSAVDPRFVDRREPLPFWRGPLTRRAWSELGFVSVGLLLAPFAFTYAVLTVSLLAGLLVTVVGLVVPSALVLGGRGWGHAYRGLARATLGVDVREPAPYRRRRGFWGTVAAPLADATGWRALLFLALSLPLAILGFTLSWTFLLTGIGAMTHWVWSRWLPLQQAPDGTWHRGGQFGPGWFVDTPARQALLALAGLLLVLLWPQVQRGVVQVSRLLVVALLGPTRASLRVADLEVSRGRTVEDADARLRRIERDLHDGTQARLVAVAMQLGEAKELLAPDGDPDAARALVGTAHDSTKEALVELREIARGIHPPALDDGLATALDTLAARAALPVTVDVDPGVGDVAPAVETIAYFCVAELVTNAAKHARASGVYVLVERHGRSLRVRVRDDGQGGARVVPADGSGRRTGLAGLVDRVRSVDGTVDLSSPLGGPTVVTVTLPVRTAGPSPAR